MGTLNFYRPRCGQILNLTYYIEENCIIFIRCMVHLSRGGADTKIFAPNINQHHVVDHTKGEPANETRY